MSDRSLQQMAVSLAAHVSRFEQHACVVLRRVDGLTGVAPMLQVTSECVQEPAEFSFVVERGDDLVAAFVTLRIVRVPTHDVAPNSIIVTVHGGHPTIVRPLTAPSEPGPPPCDGPRS
jgi:hypothetical protein